MVGVITSTNSLVGSQAGDQVSAYAIRTGFSNGSYVVVSPLWANGSLTQTGAVTWGNGNTGTSGVVGTGNSLVGAQTVDMVGGDGVSKLTADSYVVVSHSWANGGSVQAGAVSLLPGTGPSSGPVNNSNSVLGLAPNGGPSQTWRFDCTNNQLVVARPADNIVTLFKGASGCKYTLHLPAVSR